MAQHGGARPRSGPAPDPNALRRERPDDQAGWVTLPAERTDPPPEWPLTQPPGDAETVHWKRLWRTPQATQWERSNLAYEVALYVRTLAEAELSGAAVSLRKEARTMQENLGLSYVGLLKYRWKIGTAPAADSGPTSTATVTPIRPARTSPSAKDRFRRVPATTPPEE